MAISKEVISKILHEKNAVQRKIAQRLYGIFEKIGFHLTSDHFYDITPNVGEIRKSYNENRRFLDGHIDWSVFDNTLSKLVDSYIYEYLDKRGEFGYFEENLYFNGIDALAYYCYLREFAPARVIEIGQGYSTRIALAALSQNVSQGGNPSELISIDPYTRLDLDVDKASVNFTRLKVPLQQSKKMILENLSDGDLLFVDSSHVFKFGSDVQVLFEEIYPFLQIGVDVQIHDIFTPYDYPRSWMVDKKIFWNEQYFLENFLAFSEIYKIRFPINYLVAKSASLREILEQHSGVDKSSIRFGGGSFYITKIK